MIKPNFIPRTLRGVGGARLIAMPGVYFPPEVITPKPGTNPKNGRPFPLDKAWGFTTVQAAKILKIAPSSTRALLHRSGVPFRLVAEPGLAPRYYWRRPCVLELASKRPPVLPSTSPPQLINSRDTRIMLGISRATLYRYEHSGLLRSTTLRVLSARGHRNNSFFIRSEVEKLAHNLHRVRSLESRAARLRSKRCPAPPPHPIPSIFLPK